MKAFQIILTMLLCGMVSGQAGSAHEPEPGLQIGVKSGDQYIITYPLAKINSSLKKWIEGTGLYGGDFDTNSFQIRDDMDKGFMLYGQLNSGHIRCAVALELRENRFLEKTVPPGTGKLLVCLSEGCNDGCEPRMVGSEDPFCTSCDSACMKEVTVKSDSRVFN